MWTLLINSLQSIYYDSFRKSIEEGFEKLELTYENDVDLKDLKKSLVEDHMATLYFYVGSNRTYAIINKDTLKIEYMSDTDYKIDELMKSKNFLASLTGKIGDKRNLIRLSDDKSVFDYARPKIIIFFYFIYNK
jgi:hypothetical protein